MSTRARLAVGLFICLVLGAVAAWIYLRPEPATGEATAQQADAIKAAIDAAAAKAPPPPPLPPPGSAPPGVKEVPRPGSGG